MFNDFLWPLPPSPANPSDVLRLRSSFLAPAAVGSRAKRSARSRQEAGHSTVSSCCPHLAQNIKQRQQLCLPPNFKGWCLQLPLQTTLEEEGSFTWHSFSKKKHKSYKKPRAGCLNYLLLTHTGPLMQHCPPQHTHPIPKESVKHNTPSEECHGETLREGQGEKHLQLRRLFDFKRHLSSIHAESKH